MKKCKQLSKSSPTLEQFLMQAGIHPSVDNATIRAIAHILRLHASSGQKGS